MLKPRPLTKGGADPSVYENRNIAKSTSGAVFMLPLEPGERVFVRAIQFVIGNNNYSYNYIWGFGRYSYPLKSGFVIRYEDEYNGFTFDFGELIPENTNTFKRTSNFIQLETRDLYKPSWYYYFRGFAIAEWDFIRMFGSPLLISDKQQFKVYVKDDDLAKRVQYMLALAKIEGD